MVNFLSSLVNGISLGSVYAIIALGYTMVYGIAKMLNFAHGDVIMIGAYIAFTVIFNLQLPAAVAVLAAVVVCTLLGVIMYREKLTLMGIIGILLVLSAIVLLNVNTEKIRKNI